MSTESGIRDYGRFDELAEEFAHRYRRGEQPSVEEYVDRLPEMADEIREMFPALVEVERVEANARDHALQQPAAVPRLRQIGDYRILREVGRGGMGVVYEAEQISLGRRVALKVLPVQKSGDRAIQERFRREARAAAKLHHTNIVPVYEIGQDGDVRFYAMQFIDGQGLDDVITELRRLLDRARSSSGIEAATGGHSRSPWGEHYRPGIDSPTLGEGVEVGAVLRSILTGRFDPGDRGPDPAGASPPLRASDTAGGLAAPTGTGTDSRAAGSDRAPTRTAAGSATAGDATDPGPAHPPDPALSPSASPVTTSAILPGGTQLSSVESGRRAFFRSLAQIGRQVAGGLAYAHARGIIHRDIKPSNLLLDTEGVVWIADFGLAKGDDEGLTQSGDILGTLRYMAPERFRGEGDARADVYALGLTLYELLTLRPGFESSDRLRLIEQIKTEEPPRPRAIDARIPRDLETIVLKAIEKDPEGAVPDGRGDGGRPGAIPRRRADPGPPGQRGGAILAVGQAQPGDRRARRRGDGAFGRGHDRLDGRGGLLPGVGPARDEPGRARAIRESAVAARSERRDRGKGQGHPRARPFSSALRGSGARQGDRPGAGGPRRPRLALDARGDQDGPGRRGRIPEDGPMEPGCLARASPQDAKDHRDRRSVRLPRL